MAFSAVESAFEGFRLVKRSPLTILFWTALTAVYFVAYIAIFGPMLQMMLSAMAQGVEPSEAQVLSAMGGSMAFVPLFYPIAIIFSAMIMAAPNRAVLRPSESAFGYLRVGMDEVRVFLVYLVLSLVLGAAILIPYLLVFVVIGGAAYILGQSSAVLVIAISSIVILAFAAYVIWLLVRFSLALPIVVAEKRFAFFDSWKLTQGHFWSLLGMFILATVMSLVTTVLMSIIALPILWFALGGFDNLSNIQSMTWADLGPAAVIALVFYCLFNTLQIAIMYTPAASAYLGIMAERRAAGQTTVPPTA